MPLARQFKFEEVPMKKNLKALFILSGAMLLAGAALAKLPALSDEAKAKAAEAAAKTAWNQDAVGIFNPFPVVALFQLGGVDPVDI